MRQSKTHSPQYALDGIVYTRAHALRVFDELSGGPGMKFDRITFDPRIMGGRACIRGMRIPVSVIVRQIAHRATPAEILLGYPDLEPEDIQQAIEYAAWLSEEEVHAH